MENQEQKNNANFLSHEGLFLSKKGNHVIVKINSQTILCISVEKVQELLAKKEDKKGA